MSTVCLQKEKRNVLTIETKLEIINQQEMIIMYNK